jgi:flagellar biosynthesis GTPase FlhF
MINPTTGAGGATTGAAASAATVPKMDELGQDASVKLLVTRLQPQDPVSYLGTRQRVPTDLTPATPALLTATMLGDPSAGSEDPS